MPTFYRRDWKSLSPISQTNDSDGKISPNTSASDEFKKPSKEKYAHISPKVRTHWSFEEKQRIGIKGFFERKSGTSSANTSTTISPEMKPKTNRRSLPMTTDPIAVAIAQIKRNTRFYSFSESAPSSTSMSSINETPEH